MDLLGGSPKITRAGAYNFLLAVGERVTAGTPYLVAFKAFQTVIDLAAKRFVASSPEQTNSDVESRVVEVSETALSHLNETRMAITPYINPLESFSRRYYDEVIAFEGVIMALERACRNGRVDTPVLAEMTGQIELASIDPRDTSLTSI